jgi:hypothetical protein
MNDAGVRLVGELPALFSAYAETAGGTGFRGIKLGKLQWCFYCKGPRRTASFWKVRAR